MGLPQPQEVLEPTLMRTTLDVTRDIERLIGPELMEQYTWRTFAEMAEIAELSPWADELRAAEREWLEIEGA